VNLAGGKVGVDDEPARPLDEWPRSVGLQLLAELSRASVLPDNGGVDRIAGSAVPDDRGLALVGDADGRYVARLYVRPSERFDGDAQLRGPDFLGVVLDPAGPRKVLRQLFLCNGDDGALAVEDDGA
jgi:hypothetical protein